MAFLNRFKSLLSGGKRLDVKARFSLLREAISGTMSKFYMAKDRQTGKIVGLKILDAEKTAFLESRFKGLNKPCEGEIALGMKHPNLVETFEHGLTTEGNQYLVMEFLEGPGMNSLLVARHKVLDVRRVIYIRQTAEALAAVHDAGFIHRDICPRNLILTSRDGKHLKLTDFGLSVPATAEFMRPGNRTGTPNYMAPELARRQKTDLRLDVFAFGVTTYEMCTFELPWPSGDTGMAAMTHNQPPTDIREHCPKIHPELAKALHACIEPNPKERCPSVAEFLKRIRNVRQFEMKVK
ncbi:MAG: serine/threonine protein kinase [Candidatus Nealsonbacteria bacterium]|nr:serine/threonine protein kinase [Candidatus Nealsonbacteria bacterium]